MTEPTDREAAVDRLTLTAARLIATATPHPTEVAVSIRHMDGLAAAVDHLAPGLVDRIRASQALRSTA